MLKTSRNGQLKYETAPNSLYSLGSHSMTMVLEAKGSYMPQKFGIVVSPNYFKTCSWQKNSQSPSVVKVCNDCNWPYAQYRVNRNMLYIV